MISTGTRIVLNAGMMGAGARSGSGRAGGLLGRTRTAVVRGVVGRVKAGAPAAHQSFTSLHQRYYTSKSRTSTSPNAKPPPPPPQKTSKKTTTTTTTKRRMLPRSKDPLVWIDCEVRRRKIHSFPSILHADVNTCYR